MVLIVCEKEDHYQKEHSKMVKRVVIAGIQMEPKINEKKRNIEKTAYFSEEAYRNGAKIVVFPECNLVGYCYSDYHEAISLSEPVPGPSTEHLQGICKGLDLLSAVGTLVSSILAIIYALAGLALRKKSTGTLCYES